jgi:hypothetical protein
MNSNDQYKQGPKTDFGTDNPKRPELEGADGGMLDIGKRGDCVQRS